MSFLGNNEGIAVTEKYPPLPAAVVGREFNIGHDDLFGLDFKSFTYVGTTESTLVAGTAHGDLQQNAVGLAWRPDDITFVMQIVSSYG